MATPVWVRLLSIRSCMVQATLVFCAAQAWGKPLVLADHLVQFVDLPTSAVTYNPTIVPFGHDAIMAVRIDNYDGRRDQHIGVVVVDANFVAKGPLSVLDLRQAGFAPHTTEDPRLLWHGDQLLLVFNGERTWGYGQSRRRFVHVAKLAVLPPGPADEATGGRSFAVVQAVAMHPPSSIPLQVVEKNWTPFVYDNDLYFVHTINPPRVLRFPSEAWHNSSDEVWLTDLTEAPPTHQWGYGEMRGGSAALYHSEHDVYGSFFHSRETQLHDGLTRHVLGIAFYTFAVTPPFAIQSWYPTPIEVPGLHQTDTALLSCAFPGGFVQRDGRMFVAYGRNDRSANVLELDAEELWNNLQPAQ